jgi:hypothetical protein
MKVVWIYNYMRLMVDKNVEIMRTIKHDRSRHGCGELSTTVFVLVPLPLYRF